jgi:hypothetical protein
VTIRVTVFQGTEAQLGPNEWQQSYPGSPQVAYAPDGSFAVSWTYNDVTWAPDTEFPGDPPEPTVGAEHDLVESFNASGQSEGPAQVVPGRDPDVAFDSSGNQAIAYFDEINGSISGISVELVGSGTTATVFQGTEAQLGPNEWQQGYLGSPQIAYAPDGSFAVSWTYDDVTWAPDTEFPGDPPEPTFGAEHDLVESFNASGQSEGPAQVVPGRDPDVAFDSSGNQAIAYFDEINGSISGISVDIQSAACFAKGTLIATTRGDIQVEKLRIGDVVLAKFEGQTNVAWIGHRHVYCSRHRNPRNVWPVRVVAGAFAEGVPYRDLWLSPDHCVYVDDVLIPIKYLINGTSIEQVQTDQITYYHVELPQHNVLLAERLQVESYLDTGDRSKFANVGGLVALHPDLSAHSWEGMACAPLILSGHKLTVASRRLAERARLGNRKVPREPGATSSVTTAGVKKLVA